MKYQHPIQKRTSNEEADHDKSFRASGPLLFNVSNYNIIYNINNNIDINNIPNIKAEYSNMSDDEGNNNTSSNYDDAILNEEIYLIANIDEDKVADGE